MLSKPEIIIGFNGPEGQLYFSKTKKKRMVNIFSNFTQIIPMIVNILHYDLFHLVMSVQQP